MFLSKIYTKRTQFLYILCYTHKEHVLKRAATYIYIYIYIYRIDPICPQTTLAYVTIYVCIYNNNT